MKNKVSIFLTRATALALFASPFCTIKAQEVYSATIGAVSIKVPSGSDVMVALPFKQEKAAGGSVASIDGAVATLGASTLTAGEYDAPQGGAPTHYVYVEGVPGSDPLAGRHFDILSNTASAITLEESALTGLVGANISIRAHWTLGTLFPEGVGYVQELEPGRRLVEVILPQAASSGGGLAVEKIYYFFGGIWREFGQAISDSNDAGNTVVQPGSAFVVRNNGIDDIDYFFFGEVEYGPLAIPLVSSTDTVDNFVAVGRPLGLTINDLNLHSSGVFTADDRLLVYPMESQGLLGSDLQPTLYKYADNKWQEDEGDGTDLGGTLIKAGQGIAVRKAAVVSESTNFWVNEWSLSQ